MVCAFAVYSQDQLRVNGATHSSIRGTHRARVATRYRQRPEEGDFDRFADKNGQLGASFFGEAGICEGPGNIRAGIA